MSKLPKEIEILRIKMSREIKVDMVFETLLDSFELFKPNYIMNDLLMKLLELIMEL